MPLPDIPLILAELRRPIAPEDVKFRAGGAGVLAYIDARTVQERLDRVCPTWSATYTVISTDGEAIVECHLTIAGITRTDVGTGSGPEAVKSAFSDSLKRAAVAFGVWRCGYDYRPPRKSAKGGLDGRDLEELRKHYAEWLAKKGEAKYGRVWSDDEMTAPEPEPGTWEKVQRGWTPPSLEELREMARRLADSGTRSFDDITVALATAGLDLGAADDWGPAERRAARAVLRDLSGGVAS